MTGGKGKIIPAHIEPINTPYHTTAHKEVYNKSHPQAVIPPIATGAFPTDVQIKTAPDSKGQDKLLVDLQVYQDAKKTTSSKTNRTPNTTYSFIFTLFSATISKLFKQLYEKFLYSICI